MALSRQVLPVLDAEKTRAGVKFGAYILEEGSKTPDVIIVATGSEVSLVLSALPDLKAAGITARVVSMPSWKIFEEQSEAYKESIFPRATPKLAVEAGATLGWWKYVGRSGSVIGLDRFGASAPGQDRAGQAWLQRSEHRRARKEDHRCKKEIDSCEVRFVRLGDRRVEADSSLRSE